MAVLFGMEDWLRWWSSSIASCLVGGFKREITYLGDTMNTAARIEQACRDTGHPLLVSKALLDRAALPPELVAKSIGAQIQRGKAERLELFTIERSMAGGEPTRLPRKSATRRRRADLLNDARAVLDDRFRIEEQKSAVDTATAVRDPKPPFGVQRMRRLGSDCQKRPAPAGTVLRYLLLPRLLPM
jgi:hypothetical protein